MPHPSHAPFPANPSWAKVPAALQRWVDEGDLAGAVTLIARQGRIEAFDTIGFSDLATRRPMERDTFFWVASMTKPITAAAVLALADEGRLDLDDPLGKYLPAFSQPWMIAEKSDTGMRLRRPARAVTIRDLLAHLHGLEEPPVLPEGTSLAAVTTVIAQAPLQFEPGSQWKYGNASMTVLGRLVEVVVGQPYAEFLQARFFDPLGMTETTFFPDAGQIARLATTYKRPERDGPLEKAEIFLFPEGFASRARTVAPGGGLFSTAEEMFRFYQMLLNGGEFAGRRYLRRETVRAMFTSQTGDLPAGFSPGMGWGLGIGVVRQPEGWTEGLAPGTVNHDGAYGTTVFLDPSRDLLFIMMIQRTGLGGAPDGLRFRHAFTSAVMAACGRPS